MGEKRKGYCLCERLCTRNLSHQLVWYSILFSLAHSLFHASSLTHDFVVRKVEQGEGGDRYSNSYFFGKREKDLRFSLVLFFSILFSLFSNRFSSQVKLSQVGMGTLSLSLVSLSLSLSLLVLFLCFCFRVASFFSVISSLCFY